MEYEKKLFSELLCCMPPQVRVEIGGLVGSGEILLSDLSEIRLRRGGCSGLTSDGKNFRLKAKIGHQEIGDCFTKFCRGSIYAHDSTVRHGYINFLNGVRIGVCGTFSPDGKGVREISSLNIRIPHIIRGVSREIIEICHRPTGILSLLIYSAPAEGKTTLLRDVAARLSGEFMRRVAIVDSRGEIYIEEMFKDGFCDVLTGYPRGVGMEIATRSLSPEVIICDELGDLDEAKKILEAQNSGVPIIATAHAVSVSELLRRPAIRLLHDNGIFKWYAGISRKRMDDRLSRKFDFEFTAAEDVGG